MIIKGTITNLKLTLGNPHFLDVWDTIERIIMVMLG